MFCGPIPCVGGGGLGIVGWKGEFGVDGGFG